MLTCRDCKPCDVNAVIETDACYEIDSRDRVCGLGGVLISPTGVKEFFSLALDPEQRIALGSNFKKQIIFEAETLAAVIAMDIWGVVVKDFKCFFFSSTMRVPSFRS